MTEIDVPDWVVEEAFNAWCDVADVDEWRVRNSHEALRAALTAALGAWVVQRGTTYYDTRDSSLPTQVDWNHPEPGAKENVYTMRQEKPE